MLCVGFLFLFYYIVKFHVELKIDIDILN